MPRIMSHPGMVYKKVSLNTEKNIPNKKIKAAKHLAPYITWDDFNGGLFAWCHLPQGIDMMTFVQKALEKKVCVVPGTAFLTSENEPCDAFRINFSTPTDEQLTKGIELLGETIREMI